MEFVYQVIFEGVTSIPYLAYLAPSSWRLDYVMEKWPEITFHKVREHNQGY